MYGVVNCGGWSMWLKILCKVAGLSAISLFGNTQMRGLSPIWHALVSPMMLTLSSWPLNLGISDENK